MIVIIKKIIFPGILALILGFLLPVRIEADTQKLPPEEPLVGFITASYIPRTELWRNNAKTVYEGGSWPDIIQIIEYEGIEALAEIPREVGGQAWNEELDAAGRGSLFLTDLKALSDQDGSAGSRWQDDFSMVVTFRAYGAETYELNGKRIFHQEETPPLLGNEEALLGLIGGSPADYQITKAEWLGEPYTDDFGIPYRNAKVTGRRRVADYQAVYYGKAVAPKVLQTPPGEENLVGEGEDLERSEPKGSEEKENSEETLVQDEMPDIEPVSDRLRESAAQVRFQLQESLAGSWKESPAAIWDGEYTRQPSQRLSFASAKSGFIRLAKRMETWIYERFSIYIPGSLLLGAGMILGSTVAFLGLWVIHCRRKKNSL